MRERDDTTSVPVAAYWNKRGADARAEAANSWGMVARRIQVKPNTNPYADGAYPWSKFTVVAVDVVDADERNGT
jgi:hypothetical protein